MTVSASHKLPTSSRPSLSDAFGNQLASPTTGTALWASDAASAGWGHNTKEHGASTGLVYMYQRWYQPETGTFLSTAPYRPMMEHPYGFAECMSGCTGKALGSDTSLCESCVSGCYEGLAATAGGIAGYALGGPKGAVGGILAATFGASATSEQLAKAICVCPEDGEDSYDPPVQSWPTDIQSTRR